MKIHVDFLGQKKIGTVGDDGKWSVALDPMLVSTKPDTLRVYADGEGAEERDVAGVLVGDVWLVDGQSNADLTSATVFDSTHLYDKDQAEINSDDNIRLFATSRWDAFNNPPLMYAEQANPIKATYRWKKCDRDSVREFSAIGYFFAKEIAAKTKNAIPIGMVMVASGGSPLYELMPPALGQELGYTVPATTVIPVGGMFNALLAPVQKMSIKGMIYYQGESDDGRDGVYAEHLSRFVEDLRRRFNTAFPFYYVQLSSHADPAITPGKGWATIQKIRVAQLQALDLIPNSAMVVSIDQGWRDPDPDNLRTAIDWAHPIRKKPIGQRLAALALARDYKIGGMNSASSPLPEKAAWDANGVIIRFKYTGAGLAPEAGGDARALKGFTLIDADGKETPAAARITDKSHVRVEGVARPIEVRYAYTPFEPVEAANLGTKSGLPAPTFVLKK
ncbi:hypothetical protein CCAX7_32570 [Capsulimonas corticalis]|uniref:Sialate O-acetylesterase domain-containing protein n=1 Tax=Capsulimonas corticalis TaxID=2219043 RepID=A0A402D471_9BACT|nr:sialate O-acetylesterase [Capsulimonas corticalis]BDI31206.1 hypothetical protein CCAX7_32570 [Capsulimonas corticalis]